MRSAGFFRVAAAIAVAATLAATACGRDGGDDAEQSEAPTGEASMTAAQRSLEQRRDGRFELSLKASTPSTEAVGFEIEGPYSFGEGSPLAVVDLTHRRLLGPRTQESRLVSNGKKAWVVVDGEAQRLTDDQAASLRVDGNEKKDKKAGTVPDLELASWLDDGKVSRRGDRTTVTGTAHASAIVADLERLAADAAGTKAATRDEDLAKRIDEAARDTELTVVLEGDVFRSLRAVLEFGGSVPPSLRDALGPYAGATLELVVSVDDINTPLDVDEPKEG